MHPHIYYTEQVSPAMQTIGDDEHLFRLQVVRVLSSYIMLVLGITGPNSPLHVMLWMQVIHEGSEHPAAGHIPCFSPDAFLNKQTDLMIEERSQEGNRGKSHVVGGRRGGG